jgi:6,7-dimethyl-8-ribityllumazine synthase
MSAENLHWSPDLNARGLKIAIVVARFNSAITDKLLAGAKQALIDAETDVYYVPGAFELPFAARQIADGYHAIVALGAIIRGDTPHFDFVANECARGLQHVMLESGVPIAFGVLTTDNLEQAQARTGGSHGNKGFDAAMTAIEMARFGPHAS